MIMRIFNEQYIRLRQLEVVLCYLVAALVLGVNVNGAFLEEVAGAQSLETGCHVDAGMHPTYEQRFGQDILWQIPDNPKALMFIAHGRYCKVFSYFDRSPDCPQCYGLPEDRLLVLEALSRGYAVLAVKSLGDVWQTWPPENSLDLLHVTKIILEWKIEHSLENLPLVLFGNSNGGNFSTVVALVPELEVKSVVLTNSPGESQVVAAATARYPPTFFADMPRDTEKFYYSIQSSIQILRSHGVKVGEVKCWPIPLDPSFFAQRIPCIDNSTSEKIFHTFQAHGWLDDENFLIRDPNFADWRSVLRKCKCMKVCPGGDPCLALHILAELSMAFADHAFSSSSIPPIFSWLEATALPLASA